MTPHEQSVGNRRRSGITDRKSPIPSSGCSKMALRRGRSHGNQRGCRSIRQQTRHTAVETLSTSWPRDSPKAMKILAG